MKVGSLVQYKCYTSIVGIVVDTLPNEVDIMWLTATRDIYPKSVCSREKKKNIKKLDKSNKRDTLLT